MRVLVTGSSGRIGSEVIQQLVEKNYEVVGFDIENPKRLFPEVTYIQGSLTNRKDIYYAMKDVDAVIHLAAHMSWNQEDNVSMFTNNVTGTFMLLEVSVQNDISRFIFASSGEVYPETRARYQPIDEEHPLEPASFYGETKKLGEELVRFYNQRMNIPTVVLRFPHTQCARELLDPDSFFSGPRFFLQPKIRQMQLLNKYDVADVLKLHDKGKLQHLLQCDENGKSYKMHICDVRDTASGVILSLAHPDAVGETFNLTSDAPIVFSEVLPKMAEITGCEIVPVNMPGPGVNYHTSNEKIKHLLGFEPQYSFDRMLEEAAEFWSAG